MPKWVKLILALLLLPACYGAGAALWRVLAASGRADTFWVAFLAGAACWLVVFLLLPKPMLVYVFGHELTHAVWTWLMGGSVKKFKASAQGGYVHVTRNNFLVALAPYFFPLYAVLLFVLFGIGNRVWPLDRHVVWFHLLLGAAYSFHVTLTIHALGTRQSDIESQGYLFSAVVLFLGNVLVLLMGVPVLTTEVDAWTALGWWGAETRNALAWMAAWAVHWTTKGRAGS